MFFRLRAISIVAVIMVGILSPFAAHAQQPTEQRAVVEQQNTDSGLVQLSIPIGGKNSVSGLPEYIVTWYQYALGIVTIVGIIMLIVGGFKYLLSASIPEVSNGKKIIQDVIGGMVILFLAYVILYNINPKTVNLSLPDIRRIQSVPLVEQAAAPPPTTNICGTPDSGSSFRRPAVMAVRRAPGQPCSYDQECASDMCFMQNQTQGICSALASGQRCKCAGQCCGQMTNPAQSNIYLADTNNRGTGQALCQTGLTCSFQNSDWICVALQYSQTSGGVRTGTPRRPEAARPLCRLDADCTTAIGSGAACIYNSRQSDSLTGRTECSLGREGDQCRCSGYGCDLVAPPNVRVEGTSTPMGNNHGTRVMACQSGLECVGFVRPSGSLQDPRDVEYFCQASGAGALAGQCDFSCTNAPAERIHAGGCDSTNLANGIRQCAPVCNSQCAARASSCLYWREATAGTSRQYNLSCATP